MNLKKIIAGIALAATALTSAAVPATAQTAKIDPNFLQQFEAVLQEYPELILIAASRAQEKQRENEIKRMEEGAGAIRQRLSQADQPGFVLGNANGKATFIEYLDYRCGFCKRSHDEVKKLIAGNPEVRIVVVQLPVLGPQSETLARFAIAAGLQGKFEQAHNYLYENSVEPDEAGLAAAAANIGISWVKAKNDMTSEVVSKRLEENIDLARAMNVNGTPFFITPKRVVPGATTVDVLAQDI